MFRLKVFTTSVVVLLLLTSVSQSVISRSRPALTPPPAGTGRLTVGARVSVWLYMAAKQLRTFRTNSET